MVMDAISNGIRQGGCKIGSSESAFHIMLFQTTVAGSLTLSHLQHPSDLEHLILVCLGEKSCECVQKSPEPPLINLIQFLEIMPCASATPVSLICTHRHTHWHKHQRIHTLSVSPVYTGAYLHDDMGY